MARGRSKYFERPLAVTSHSAGRGALIVKHNAHPTQTAERVADVLKQRGVAKVHPASEFAGADPPDELADDLGDLVNGRAKKIDEAGPLPGTGSLGGQPKTLRGEPGTSTYRSGVRENEAAVTLKEQGYHVEQLPEPTGSTSILDYRINGHDYDCYAPFYDPTLISKTPAKAIEDMWKYLDEQKFQIGKGRVVLNLDDFQVPPNDVLDYFRNNQMVGNVDDLLVLKNGQIMPFWDFLR